MFDSDEIAGRIKGVLVQALNVDEGEVTSASRLQADLGAESIDMLDIVFRLEREFGLRIPRTELFPESVFQGDPAFVQGGRVTDAGMTELRVAMPYAELGEFNLDRRVIVVPDLFTVDLIARYITWKLRKNATRAMGAQTQT
jgi:acyl carrier protein